MKEIVSQEVNLKMFDFFHETNKDPYPRRFPYHDIKSDFHELWGSTVEHKILHIEKYKENHYVVLVEVQEYIMEYDFPQGEYLTNEQKVIIIIDELKKYFLFDSKADVLKNKNETEIETLIKDYLLNDEESFLLKMNLGHKLLWSIGSRFKLKLKKYDIKATCHGNLCKHIEIRNFTTDIDKGTLAFWKPTSLKPIPVIK